MSKSRIEVNIAGMSLALVSEDEPAYVQSLAKDLNAKIQEIMDTNDTVSVAQAALLVALDCEDDLKKHNNSSENLRSQIKDYLEDAARARMEAETYKRELEKYKSGK